MAKLFDNPGYSVVETNHIAAVRNGNIKAQYPCFDIAIFENGMVAEVIDTTKIVRLPVTGKEFVYLHASEERIYESHLGRASWFLNGAIQIPKMLKFAVGDLFETDAVDAGNFINVAAAEADAVFGVANRDGLIELMSDAEAVAADIMDEYAVVFKVVEFIRLPNERPGIKFVVIKAEPNNFLLAGRRINEFGFLAVDNDPALAIDVDGVIDEFVINVEVPFGTDVTALIATFDASKNAIVEVDGDVQESGVTENDFTEPVTYTVIAENGLINTYTVIVTIAEED